MNALLVDGSLHGAGGNTAHFLGRVAALLAARGAAAGVVHLAEGGADAVRRTLEADLVVYGTGTYWDGWGSPLQRYLERLTEHELSDGVLGKPAGVVVTMDSVGGTGVLYRLQGALSGMGFLIPPLTGVVLSRVGAMARHPRTRLPAEFDPPDDVWGEEDLEVLAANLLAARTGTPWARWPIARSAAPRWPKAPPR
jgi:hypothetical protein